MAAETHRQIFPAKRLEAFGAAVLKALGLPEEDAAFCAARMIDADLRGVDTHGIFRLPHYSQRIRLGSRSPIPSAPRRASSCRSGITRDTG
ncbi:MAG: Ldh family oxidoreductase [Syntrophales bacterium]